MQVELPVSTAVVAPDRVVHVDASALLGRTDDPTEPPADPEPSRSDDDAAAPADESRSPGPDVPASGPTPSPVAATATPVTNLAIRDTAALRMPLLPMRLDKERTARKRSPKGRRGKSRKCLETDPRISAKGEGRFSIDRQLVDAYTSDLKTASTLAWVGWHRDESGSIKGFRVKRIRCGSVLHQAGFRNGDVIQTVNGRPVTSIPQALSAYRKLRKNRILNVELQRKGAVRKLRYRLS
jgi:hypothetical protein